MNQDHVNLISMAEDCNDLQSLIRMSNLQNWNQWMTDHLTDDLTEQTIRIMEATLFKSLFMRLHTIDTKLLHKYKIHVYIDEGEVLSFLGDGVTENRHSLLDFTLNAPTAWMALRLVLHSCRIHGIEYERVTAMEGETSDKDHGDVTHAELVDTPVLSSDEDNDKLEADEDETCNECGLVLEDCICDEDEDIGDDSEDDDVEEPDEEEEDDD